MKTFPDIAKVILVPTRPDCKKCQREWPVLQYTQSSCHCNTAWTSLWSQLLCFWSSSLFMLLEKHQKMDLRAWVPATHKGDSEGFELLASAWAAPPCWHLEEWTSTSKVCFSPHPVVLSESLFFFLMLNRDPVIERKINKNKTLEGRKKNLLAQVTTDKLRMFYYCKQGALNIYLAWGLKTK